MKRILFLLLLLCIPNFVFAEELIPNAKSGILIEKLLEGKNNSSVR